MRLLRSISDVKSRVLWFFGLTADPPWQRDIVDVTVTEGFPDDAVPGASTSGSAKPSSEASTSGSGFGGPLNGRIYGHSVGGKKAHIIRELSWSRTQSLCGRPVPLVGQKVRFKVDEEDRKLCRSCVRLALGGAR